MANLGGVFDATQVEPTGDFTPVPPGDYKVQILSSEMVENSARTGHMLKLELEILEGDQAGRKLYDRLNLDNPNAQAVEIAQRTLSAICHAVGKLSVQDSDELHMLPMVATVKVDPPRSANGREYGPSNSIKTYKAAGASASPRVSASSGFKPQMAGSGQSASAPWKRNAA
jgi:Protein of unknown function (DUF669)